jgi:hypothetical protein
VRSTTLDAALGCQSPDSSHGDPAEAPLGGK